MKRASFEVAIALKEAGYPQYDLSCWYDRNGTIITTRPKDGTIYYVSPTYLDVWLWLWREKGVKIDIISRYYAMAIIEDSSFCENDPEKAIEKAIKYLVENDLIK